MSQRLKVNMMLALQLISTEIHNKRLMTIATVQRTCDPRQCTLAHNKKVCLRFYRIVPVPVRADSVSYLSQFIGESYDVNIMNRTGDHGRLPAHGRPAFNFLN